MRWSNTVSFCVTFVTFVPKNEKKKKISDAFEDHRPYLRGEQLWCVLNALRLHHYKTYSQFYKGSDNNTQKCHNKSALLPRKHNSNTFWPYTWTRLLLLLVSKNRSFGRKKPWSQQSTACQCELALIKWPAATIYSGLGAPIKALDGHCSRSNSPGIYCVYTWYVSCWIDQAGYWF